MTASDDWPLSPHAQGTLIRVLVVPGASRSEIVGRHGDAVRVRIAAPAEGGRANRALEDLIAGRCGGPVEVVKGAGARRKLVLVVGGLPERVAEQLGLERDR